LAVRDSYRLLGDVVRLAASSRLSPPARLRAIVRRIERHAAASSVTVFVCDPAGRMIRQRYSSLSPSLPVACAIPYGRGAAGICAAGETAVVLDFPQLHPHEHAGGHGAVCMAFPVSDGERAVAVLSLVFAAEMPRPPLDARLTDSLCGAISQLLGRMADMDMARRHDRGLASLTDFARSFTKDIPDRSILSRILSSLHRHGAASATFVRLGDWQGGPPVVMRKCLPRFTGLCEQLTTLEEEFSRRVTVSGQMLLSSGNIPLPPDIPPALCVPLLHENRPFGTITLFYGGRSSDPASASCPDQTLCAGMALIVAGVLQRAATVRSLNSLAEEHRKKLREISLLYRLSTTMLSPISINRVFHLILTALTSGSNPFFDRSMLFLVNRRSGFIQGMLGVTRETNLGLIQDVDEAEPLTLGRWDISEAEMGCQRDAEFSRQVRSSRFDLDGSSGSLFRAVTDKRLVHLADAGREGLLPAGFVDRFGLSSCAIAPLITREGPVGLLLVDNGSTRRPISRDDLRFLQLFASQAGMAYENALLATRMEDTGRELRETQERLIQGEKLAAIGEMAANIAHELKNPLVSIGGFARRLKKGMPSGSAERDAAERIVSEVRRLERMLTDILSFSKQPRLCYEQCSMNDLVEDTLSTMTIPLQESGVRVVRRLPPADAAFSGDGQQLKQVLLNLFFNARDAMKNGGVLEVAVESTTLGGKPAIALSVADTGNGIPLEVLHNIFNPFFTTKSGGTGLGLPIVHRIVDNHGGKITVMNRLSGGACFTVVLPLEPASKSFAI
jgi:signal transduction histidine kinase